VNFENLSTRFLNDDFSEFSGFGERNCLNFFLFSSLCEFWLSVDEIFVKIAMYLNFAILENESNTDNKIKHGRFGRIFVTFYPKSKEKWFQKPRLLHTPGWPLSSFHSDSPFSSQWLKNKKEGHKRPSFYKIALAVGTTKNIKIVYEILHNCKLLLWE